MKKLLLAAALLITGATFAANYNTTATTIQNETGKGIHISPSQVPPAVMATFTSRYPAATNVKWQVEKEHGQIRFQADFANNGVRMRAYFAADGTFLGERIR